MNKFVVLSLIVLGIAFGFFAGSKHQKVKDIFGQMTEVIMFGNHQISVEEFDYIFGTEATGLSDYIEAFAYVFGKYSDLDGLILVCIEPDLPSRWLSRSELQKVYCSNGIFLIE